MSNNSEYRKYIDSLPRKRMSAGAIFFDDDCRVLLLRPTYKKTWLIPGGVVEYNESPREACEREVWEEIGLKISAEKLLAISYGKANNEKSESLRFIFFGGLLKGELIKKIKLDKKEISDFLFCEKSELKKYLAESLCKRVCISIEAYKNKATAYIEN